MAHEKTCYGIPPKPDASPPIELISASEAARIYEERAQHPRDFWIPGWRKTIDGFVHPRYGERRLLAIFNTETGEICGDKILRLEPKGAVTIPWGIDAMRNIRLAFQWQYRDATRKPDAPPWEYGELHHPEYFGCWSLEIPRGFGKEKVAAETIAKEEATEEMGFGKPIGSQALGLACPNTTFDTPQPVFAVQYNIVPPDPRSIRLDPTESVAGIIGWMTLKEINKSIVQQQIYCAFTKAAVAEFCAMLETGELRFSN
ncbi:MAG: hypothetical protein A2806_03825 [Candidatus Terrybacteria bacterium RIFCSPHIGHO2_01_FULL_48_17]|uniref:Nudix hydrolase domain-containing protein n=1 Tax=Candidatus Terrybacteria bacterium RIFCSPHIGHO2_01_FULL_48_17 TaxID=1802362 RepID=A0A1G2PKA2_9BACT|nr:MAG: hypothetical protein A2806_03825 [Candidatus Terrybacteria bacterium RIFCSPHIGHO2_01_FULL_48_17]OHA53202.1 MAG: hypothetical protein A3A30_04495 [Candidatus Terrybacteria bacterium RIFCSPLOWO2_01_FULL_48_14]